MGDAAYSGMFIPTSRLAALLRFRVGAFELECNRAANRARGERVCRVCEAFVRCFRETELWSLSLRARMDLQV
jgi:hypothetical protein